MKIGELIKKHREEAGLTQKKLSVAVGRSKGLISQIESGDSIPSWDLSVKIFKELSLVVYVSPVSDKVVSQQELKSL